METFSPEGINNNLANRNKGFKGSYLMGEISGASNNTSGSFERRFLDRLKSICHCGARTQISSAFVPDTNSEHIIAAISAVKFSFETDLQ
jgi:hypothetical protein